MDAFRILRIGRTLLRNAGGYARFSRTTDLGERRAICERLAADLTHLGPTFVKLGQILSTRPDLLPPAYVEALSVLQDRVPPVPFANVRDLLEEELGDLIGSLFGSFDEAPAASASLAQVHMATLEDGTPLAVKVQRPGAARCIRRDLDILGRLLAAANPFLGRRLRNLDLPGVFKEFRRYTLQELDFANEGHTLTRFRRNFRDTPEVHFPKVYWPLTRRRVLTMERVGGLKLSEIDGMLSAEERRKVARTIISAQLEMFIRDAFFHADLHPGNIFFGKGGRLEIVDVGMYGELTPAQRDRFLLYWLAVVQKQKRRAFHHLLRLSTRRAWADPDAYFRDYERVLQTFYDSTITEKSLTRTYLEVLGHGARYGFLFPREMLLQAKALTTVENLAFVLAPGFRFADETRPLIIEILGERVSEGSVAARIEQSLPEWLLLGETLPPEATDTSEQTELFWSLVGRSAARRNDAYRKTYREVWHGEAGVTIDDDLESVFNFVSRLAQYTSWHPAYTEASRVIHVSGHYVVLQPGGVGSVFRLDEIVDGQQLLSNAEIVEFERNRLMKWRAPFSILPLMELGTCFHFERLGPSRTQVSEFFFFSDSLLKYGFIDRRWFSVDALTEHIREELHGVKRILEGRACRPADREYLWEGIEQVVRL